MVRGLSRPVTPEDTGPPNPIPIHSPLSIRSPRLCVWTLRHCRRSRASPPSLFVPVVSASPVAPTSPSVPWGIIPASSGLANHISIGSSPIVPSARRQSPATYCRNGGIALGIPAGQRSRALGCRQLSFCSKRPAVAGIDRYTASLGFSASADSTKKKNTMMARVYYIYVLAACGMMLRLLPSPTTAHVGSLLQCATPQYYQRQRP